MAHRISGVLKSNGHRELLNYGSLASFSKHHRYDTPAASLSYWEKPRSMWLAICIFFAFFALFVFILPASVEIPLENPEPGHQALLRKGLRRLPFEQKNNALAVDENTEVERRSNKEWQLKPDHFTLFNLSSMYLTYCLLGNLSSHYVL